MHPKLLWHSNAPFSSTGYGAQTALFTPQLKKAGYDIAISAFYGLEGAPLEHNGIVIYPGLSGTFGNETIVPHARSFFGGDATEGLIVTLMDVWVLDADLWKDLKTASWVPVDHDPVPPMVAKYFATSDAIPIAMSRFGEERLRDFDPLYCPHAVDTKVYKPIPKKEARKRANLPEDAFVVGMVAANKGNPSRKCFPQALQAFKAFHERHDDALLYLHTEMLGRFEGVNLPNLINTLGLADCVALTDQYRYMFAPIPSDAMAAVYSSMDVLLNPAAGEGFGLPVLEANSCGTPAIVTDFSAMSEVCGAGWKVEHRPTYTPQMAWQADPDVEDIVESLESAYRQPEAARKQTSERARGHAKDYDIELVLANYMLPALKEVEERVGLKVQEPVEVVAA